MDRGVFLARRLRGDQHAAVQNFLAGQRELRLPTAKQCGEHFAEMAIHLIERGLQLIARFAVDAADGVFKRRHRLVQIVGLCVEIIAALGRGLEFFQCGEIDRAQRTDFFVDAVDFGLQRV